MEARRKEREEEVEVKTVAHRMNRTEKIISHISPYHIWPASSLQNGCVPVQGTFTVALILYYNYGTKSYIIISLQSYFISQKMVI